MNASADPLRDVLVVDLSRALAGPHAAMMLGDLGARVIKIENPRGGDDTRGWGPPFTWPDGAGGYVTDAASAPDGLHGARESTYFLSTNRNKESIALDLKRVEDRAVLDALLRRADVVVENFRTGVLDRLGYGIAALHALNPRLVILSITGFGHDGPEGGRAGYDQIAQGEAGLMSITGSAPDDPQKSGVPIADLLAGMYGAYGVAAALHERNTTGVGRVVRTSLLASVIGVHAFQGTRWTVAREVGRAAGNHHPSISPYGMYLASDGPVQIAVGSQGLWHAFCAGFGIDPETEGFATNAERVQNRAALGEVINGVFGTWTSEDLLAELDELGIPAGKIRTIDQAYEWDQTRSQGLLIDVEHSTLGPVTLPGPPIRFFDGDDVEDAPREHRAPPTLDEHGSAIRAWLGVPATATQGSTQGSPQSEVA